MKKALLLLCLFCYAGMAQQREFTVATYNSLRYSPQNIDARHPYYRQIIDSIKPDILVMEELSGSAAATMFLDSVMNFDSTTYSIASFSDGPDLDIALYFKSVKFSVLPTINHPTALRDIFHFRLLPVYSEDTLYVFGVHLKASSGSANEAKRAAEVAVLRSITNQFPDSTNFLVCGDFNIYGSNELAYQNLLADNAGDDGNFLDIITMNGTWNNGNYAQYHTQSPRTTQFGGGAHGGMDDRFDMILMSNELKSASGIGYKANSMYVFGNDGLHYNKAITDAPNNNQYDQDIRMALHQASDHLPVAATFAYTPTYVGLEQLPASEKVGITYSREGVATISNQENLTLDVTIYTIQGQVLNQFIISNSKTLHLKQGAYVIQAEHQGQTILIEKFLN